MMPWLLSCSKRLFCDCAVLAIRLKGTQTLPYKSSPLLQESVVRVKILK